MAFVRCIRSLKVVALCSWIASVGAAPGASSFNPATLATTATSLGKEMPMADPAEFTGKVAMITRSSGGIGLRVAEQLAEAGANVSITVARPSEVSGPRRCHARPSGRNGTR
jgi:3-oxoacyl-ACP reductase-like protein